MNIRRWNLIVGTSFLLGGVLVAAFNYFVDPYEVFGHDYLRSGYAVNERFRKMEHLLQGDAPHDSYIVGSSVMGVYDPRIASSLTGNRFYNLSVLAGTPREAYMMLKTLKAHGKPIREVLIGVDFFTFYEHPLGKAPMSRHHPSVTGESWLSFYSSFLFSSGLWQGMTRLQHHLQPEASIHFDVDGTGQYRLLDYDRRIAADHTRYISKMFPANQWDNADVVWVDDRFAEFAELCGWLDENDIEAHVFVHPFYRDTLATVSKKSYAEFLARLRKIKPELVDLSGAAAITADPHWYYDKRHYRPVVANRIMEIMLGKNNSTTRLEGLGSGEED